MEAIINCCTITKASTDPSDLEALTANHLLLLRMSPSLPPGEFKKEDVYACKRWAGPVHVILVLEKIGSGVFTTSSRASEVDKSQTQL